MKALRLKSFAKVNLGLEVLGRREDGYHELRTIFQTIDLHDDVVIRVRPREIEVRCAHPLVPAGGENLAARAARELQRFAGFSQGAEITITKRIPVAGGLGGGSSNAAVVLLGLDRIFGLGLGVAGLMRLARRLGADVPYFLLGGTALGLGRGDEIYPLHRQVRGHVVVVDPGLPVSTAGVFARVDAGLTPRENSNSIFHFVSSELEGVGAFRFLSNELEEAALEEEPKLVGPARRIRDLLAAGGARLVALSGSGSSYFGLFDEGRRARRAHAALVAAGFASHVARTLTLAEYQRAMRGRGTR
jgi:4-diphosphocytidyl-2-C-methyl-D-erythritol kinase